MPSPRPSQQIDELLARLLLKEPRLDHVVGRDETFRFEKSEATNELPREVLKVYPVEIDAVLLVSAVPLAEAWHDSAPVFGKILIPGFEHPTAHLSELRESTLSVAGTLPFPRVHRPERLLRDAARGRVVTVETEPDRDQNLVLNLR